MSTSIQHADEGTNWAPVPSPTVDQVGRLRLETAELLRIGAAFLLLLGSLPAFGWHIAHLLTRPHYQFVAFLPVAIWLLISARNERSRIVIRTRGLTMFTSLLLGVAVQAAAAILWSPWLAIVGTWLTVPAGLWLIGGSNLLRYVLPAWIFSLVVIPPPFGLDEDLIVSLRDITTRMTSAVLDQLGVLHVSYANVIEVPGKTLFVADACSGIHSLYVLLASALLIALWNRRSLAHGLLLLFVTSSIVLAENVARLVLITVALQWQIDCTEGLAHTLLGIGLFCTSLGLVASVDQFLLFLFGEGRAPFGYLPPLASTAKAASAWTVSATTIVAALTPVIGGIQLANIVTHWPDHPRLMIPELEIQPLPQETLPSQLGPYRLERFERVKRVHGDPFGQASDQWTFVGDQTTVTISVDHPFETIHDLCVCYENIGWTVDEKQVLSADELPSANAQLFAPVAVGRLHQSMNGEAFLCFSHMDRNGQLSAAVRGDTQLQPQQNVRRRIASLMAVDHRTEVISTQAKAPPFIQFHLFARTAEPLSPQRIESLKAFYLEARDILVQAIEASDGPVADVRPASSTSQISDLNP